MKKILALLIVAVFASTAIAADKKEPAKKPVAAKKEVKKHKKFDGEKVEGTKPDTPAKKK
jgi:hypothetical protein